MYLEQEQKLSNQKDKQQDNLQQKDQHKSKNKTNSKFNNKNTKNNNNTDKDKDKDKNLNKKENQLKYNNINFQFTQDIVQCLIFKKPDIPLLEDIHIYTTTKQGKTNIYKQITAFLLDEKNLSDSASYSHQILMDFTYNCPYPKVPSLITKYFIKILLKNNYNRMKPKYLSKEFLSNTLLKYFNCMILRLINRTEQLYEELYNSLFYYKIPKLINLTQHIPNKKIFISLIKKLIKQKKYKELRTIPNINTLFNNQFKDIKITLLLNSARYHFRTYGWQQLQDIFQYFPDVVANIINKNVKTTKDNTIMKGFLSICQNNINISKKINPKLYQQLSSLKINLKQQNQPLPINSLRIDKFQPSSQQYFSLQEFGVKEDDVVWVDENVSEQILLEILKEIGQCDVISIDTESKIARTALQAYKDHLSLIQISTQIKTYLFDPIHPPNPKITKNHFKQYFHNEYKKIIGHTIRQDVQLIADYYGIQGFNCHIIDIKDEYKQEGKKGLKDICKAVLGKQICKKYCMTNWQRRPLYRCQKHYAAMDAYIIYKILQKLQISNKKSKNKQENKIE